MDKNQSLRAGWRRHEHWTLGCAALLALAAGPVMAQQALRESVSGEYAARSLRKSEQPPYNVKAGPVSMTFDAGLVVGATDNVDAVSEFTTSDVYFRPTLNANAVWNVTPLNTLNFAVGVGYTKYASESRLDSFYIRPGTELSFNVFVGDFRINVHDRFSYQQDPTQRPDNAGNTVAGSGGQFGVADNIIGIQVDWDLNKLILTWGYDFASVMSFGSASASLDRNSHLFFLRGSVLQTDAVRWGVETTVGLNRFQTPINDDSLQFTAGPFVEWRVSEYIRAVGRGGYLITSFDNSGLRPATGDVSSYYLSGTIEHLLNQYFSHSLSFSRSSDAGLNANLVEVWTIRYGASANVIRDLRLSADMYYNTGREKGTFTPEQFDQFGFGIGTGYQITEKLSASLAYNFVIRGSDQPLRDYTQNTGTLSFFYRF
jgi:hypothetical protein